MTRIGLRHGKAVPARDALEIFVELERGEELFGQIFTLVGADRENGAFRPQRLERGRHPREGTAFDRDIGVVMDEELGEHRLDVLACCPKLVQALLDHGSGAKPHGLPHRLSGDAAIAPAHEHVVERVGEVWRRIHQCPVQVENDGGAGQVVRSQGPSILFRFGVDREGTPLHISSFMTETARTAPTIGLKDPSLLRTECLIGEAWVGTPKLAVRNPATGELIASVPDLGAAETRAAIDAASSAFKVWRAKLAKERSAILRRWYDLIIAHKEDLALLMTSEQGKPLAEARGEIDYGASFVEFFAEEAKRIYGEVIPTHKASGRILVLKQPLGVAAAITPWNFPVAMITRKIAPALAAGCTVVVKPAPETPLSALALAELGVRAGFPAGVLNVVTGDAKAIGGELTSNPLVRALTFTGSTAVGKLLMAQSAATMKKLSLELGGNAPFIVFDDADLDAAIAGALASKYRNSGQTCVCANRILVQDGIYDRFAAKLVAEVAKLKVGDGAAAGVTQGPLINKAAVEKVEAHIGDALAKGARAAIGGKPHALGRTFFEPTVLVDVTPDMLIAREETFGPVAPLFRFKAEEDAIRLANDTPFGLASYVYTASLARAWRVAEALEYGMVGVNEGLISTELAPFGGFKESGLGREGSHHGIEEFVELKYVLMGGLDG